MKVRVSFVPSFARAVSKLDRNLQDEIFEKIEEFENTNNHKHLKVHKLKGNLKKYYSFSVNYKMRILFLYHSKNEAVLLTIGGHEIYKSLI